MEAVMTIEQEMAIAVQEGAYKVLSGEMTAENFWCYYIDQSLFPSIQEFVRLVNKRVQWMQ
jgi:hypothetical protein